MRLARLLGLSVPPCGLVSLRDGSRAYVIKRFDRTDGEPPQKLLLEDFCSLLGLDPTGKYLGTDEDCAKVIEQYAAHPERDLRRLLRQLAFSFLVSNADLHLKNLALLENPADGYELSPAYDLLCTGIYAQFGKEMAIALNGRKDSAGREDFIEFAARHLIPEAESGALLDDLLARVPGAEVVIERSSLPRELRSKYSFLLRKRARMLAPRRSRARR